MDRYDDFARHKLAMLLYYRGWIAHAIELNRHTYDVYENTCKCGELKLSYIFPHPP